MTNNILDVDEMPYWLSTLYKGTKLRNVVAGINQDDCAVISVGKQKLVISTDYLNAKPIAVEFNLGGYWDLGRLLVAANLSDLCGTGALPIGFLTAVMFKKSNSNDQNFKLFMTGVKYQLDKAKIPLIGGDSKLGEADCYCGIALGIEEKKSKLFLKNAAKIGDDIWVSGKLGGVAAAIDGIGNSLFESDIFERAKAQIISPKLPLLKSRYLAKNRLANGGIDISDGLGADLWSLCFASKVGARIFPEKIPISGLTKAVAKTKGILPWIYTMTVGGDFQFLVTSHKRNANKIKKAGFCKIGEIIKENEAFININGNDVRMPTLGHRDSRKRSFFDEVEGLVSYVKEHLQ